MKNENYIRAMRKVEPSGDFEQKALARLEREKGKRKMRFVLSGAAVTACAVAAAIIIPALTGAMPAPPAAKEAFRSAEAVYDPEEPAGQDGAAFEEDASFELYAAVPRSNAPIVPNTEEYASYAERGFRYASAEPLSTFAADVDTASYTRLRRSLLDGRLPAKGSVRPEEVINYFSYPDLIPKEGDTALTAYLSSCPWNPSAALLFVGFGAAKPEKAARAASNLVFLVDVSGSMDGPDRLGLIKRAFALLADELTSSDTVSVVTYAASDRVVLDGVNGSRRDEILDAVESMNAGGGTNGADAINTAYALAERYFIPGGINRVILMTDGDLNLGVTSEAELTDLISRKRDGNVFLSVFGFGVGNLKDNKLEALADRGNGMYCYIDSLTEARRSLVSQISEDFRVVAKDVKFQVEFNPAVVSSYRLIGYEDRRLESADFADDSRDGGEVGTGQTVVALYEILPAQGVTIAGAEGKPDPASPALRYAPSAQGSPSGEVAAVSMRYKDPEGSESRLVTLTVENEERKSRSMDLACAAAEFALALSGSEYAPGADLERAARSVRELEGLSDAETELAYLMIRARELAQAG